MKPGCEPYQEKLALQILGELAPEDARDLDSHLRACPHCRDTRDKLLRTVDLLGPPPEYEVTDLETARLEAGYYKRLARRRQLSTTTGWKIVITRTAAVLALVALGYLGRGFIPDSNQETTLPKTHEIQVVQLEELRPHRPGFRLSPEGLRLIARGRKGGTD